MGFSISYGEKYIITSGDYGVLERVFQNKPVWVYDDLTRVKTFTSLNNANKFFTKNNLDVTACDIVQVKELYKPVFNIRINDNKIESKFTWSLKSDPNKHYQFDHDDKDNAEIELRRLKGIMLQKYQEMIMHSITINLPEFK